MRKQLLKITAIAVLAIGAVSCGTETTDEKSNEDANNQEKVIEKEVEKSVKVEINNSDTTVTIETTKDGETTTEVLTGQEAAAYMSNHEMDKMNTNSSSEDVKIIVKKIEGESGDVDIDEILNDADLEGLGEGIKEEIKESLEEVEMKEGEIKIKTKIKSTTSTEK